ncbi:MAG: hypothetical protein R2940_05245 [Syntrophotaleaceae bacterium]
MLLKLVMLFSILLASCLSAYGGWFTDHTNLEYNITFAPPHNEPVVGDRVARYRVQLRPSVEFKYFRYNLKIDAWACNTWQSNDVIGNGGDAWDNSDYSIEKWRIGFTHRAEAGPKIIHLFTEYYVPYDNDSWGGHGMERHYYWLVGFGGKFW